MMFYDVCDLLWFVFYFVFDFCDFCGFSNGCSLNGGVKPSLIKENSVLRHFSGNKTFGYMCS